MAEIINMPKLSDTMEEGVVSKWLKKIGDTVKEGDILAEIETDKATMEFESFYSGTLLHIAIEEGGKASVDALLAIIGDENEDISAVIKNKANSSNSKEETKESSIKETTPTTESEQASKEIEPPKNVQLITMPRLSDTMVEGAVSKWLKKVGDAVKEGDILAEIETDKATMEFESFYSGTLLHIAIEEGSSTPIDALLAIIGKKGTDVEDYIKFLKEQKTKTPKSSLQKEEVTSPTETKQPLFNQKAKDSNNERVFISPIAHKMASERKINIKHLVGTGESGRIIKKDIEDFIPQSFGQNSIGKIVTEEVPNSQMRKIIAKRLSESKFTSPHYYLNIEIDMSEIIAFRTQLNTLKGVKVSFNDLVVKACALSLRDNPKVNSSWTDDVTKIHKHINIGVAVAIEDGLVVPVLNFTDTMSLFEIGSRVKELAIKANEKKLTPEEMSGSTFTVSNLGMFGIYEFTSIINQPNSAILSVGTIVEKPVVKKGQVIPGHTMKVTLSCDHRTVDGATGAVFLQSLKSYIENPVSMIA